MSELTEVVQVLRSRQRSRTAYLFLAPFVAVFGLFLVLPIGVAVYKSLFKLQRSGLGIAPPTQKFVGLGNYSRALHDSAFRSGAETTLMFAAIAIPVMIVSAVALALLLDAGTKRWSGWYRAIIFAPYAVPGVVAVLLWGFLYNKSYSPLVSAFDHLDHGGDPLGARLVLGSIANISLWEFIGYNMIICLANLQSIPPEIFDAAKMDGCGEVQLALRVKLPYLKPALVLIALFTLIGSLQLFNEPLILQSVAHTISTHYTPNLYAYNTAFTRADSDYASALAVIIALVTIALSTVFLKLTRRSAGGSQDRTTLDTPAA